jgi:RNA polymerase sigma factor (sigma-70 family)
MVQLPRSGERTDAQLLEAFISRHDEAAFTALVRRHGPMVLGVCKRVLQNVHDAEDAFQATFLILARRADTIGNPAALPGWLHEVARRTAARARTTKATRRMHERRVPDMPKTDFIADVAWRDLQPILDEEVGRLPEQCRVPFVLCYLEGYTYEKAAAKLRCLPGTISRRLARARELLRRRLTQRGLALPAGVLAAALSQNTAPAAMATPLAASTVKVALASAAGTAAAGVVSAKVAALVDGGLRAMALTTTRFFTVLLLAVSLLAVSGGGLAYTVLANQPGDTGPAAKKPDAAARVIPADAAKAEQMIVMGSVVDAAGKPVPQAHVALLARRKHTHRAGDGIIVPEALAQGRADGDGRFRLILPRTSKEHFWSTFVNAIAEGHGLGLEAFDADAARPEVTIRLPAEQVLRGRLLDLQGVAAPGVTVQVSRLAGDVFKGHGQELWYSQAPTGLKAWPGAVVTDAEGRFTLRGVPRDASVTLQMDGDRFAVQQLVINPDAQMRNLLEHEKRNRFHTPPVIETKQPMPGQPLEIAWSLVPAHVLHGTVTYADTGKSVPNARLVCFVGHGHFYLTHEARKDYRAGPDGRFRIVNEPGTHLILVAYPEAGTPYLLQTTEFAWPGPNVPQHRLDVKLSRAVLVQGKVTEGPSGKPVAGASVEFVPRRDGNALYRKGVIGPLNDLKQIAVTAADGAFTLPVLPGTGQLLVNGPTLDYLRMETTERKLSTAKDGGRRYYPNALVALDLKPDTATHQLAVSLRRGVTVKGKVVGSDGKPATDLRIFYRSYIPQGYTTEPMPTLEPRDGRFELPGLDPDRPEPVYFLDIKNQRGAVVSLPGKRNGEPATVHLQPCGTVVFRPVDKEGKAVAGFRPHVEVLVTPGATSWEAMIKNEVAADFAWMINLDHQRYDAITPDKEGRVTLPTLLPGATLRLLGQTPTQGIRDMNRTFTVAAGQTVDLKDLPFPAP